MARLKVETTTHYRAYWNTPHGELRTFPMSKSDAQAYADAKGGYIKPAKATTMKTNPAKRSRKARTPAQIAATKKLVALMKAKRASAKVRKLRSRGASGRATTLEKRQAIVARNARISAQWEKNPARRVRKLRPVGQKFCVQVKRKAAWVTLCSFAQLAMAKEYATALHRKYPSQTLRVFSK